MTSKYCKYDKRVYKLYGTDLKMTHFWQQRHNCTIKSIYLVICFLPSSSYSVCHMTQWNRVSLSLRLCFDFHLRWWIIFISSANKQNVFEYRLLNSYVYRRLRLCPLRLEPPIYMCKIKKTAHYLINLFILLLYFCQKIMKFFNIGASYMF